MDSYGYENVTYGSYRIKDKKCCILTFMISMCLLNRIFEEAAEGLHLLSDKLPPPGTVSISKGLTFSIYSIKLLCYVVTITVHFAIVYA